MKYQGINLLLLILVFSFNAMAQDNIQEYKLIWADEFNNENIDINSWSYQTGAHGWGNNEWQNYTTSNANISNGTLKITAKLEGEGQKVGDYTSSRMLSKKTFTYGKFEVRAKIPDYKGQGIWPAIWMLGENVKTIGWPECGEIDMMEYVSYAPDTAYFTLHSIANNHRNGKQITSGPVKLSSIEEEFHNYGLIWTENNITFYLDTEDNIVLSFDKPENPTQENWPYQTPFYFIFNIAVGGNWGGLHGVDDSIFPATMEIDYIRCYQKQ